MNGASIWNICSTIIQTITDFATGAIRIFTTPLDIVINDALGGTEVGSAMANVLTDLVKAFGNPTLLQLMFGSIALIVVISLAKWVIDIFT